MVKTFCCGCSLRSGAITAAVLNTFGVATSYVYCFTAFINADYYRKQSYRTKGLFINANYLNENYEDAARESMIDGVKYLVQAVVGTIILVLLCIGIHKRSPNFILPWLIVTCIGIIIWSIFFVFFAIGVTALSSLDIASGVRTSLILFLLVFLGAILFEIYLFTVVLGYYRSLQTSPGQTISVLVPTTSVGYDASQAWPVDTKTPPPHYEKSPGGSVQYQLPPAYDSV